MSEPAISIRRLRDLDATTQQQLADVLIDCVEAGASIGFMRPLSRERVLAFWRRIAADVGTGDRVLLVADLDGHVCGTVQLVTGMPDNGPHRADVAKMMVHRRARRRGVGAALLRAVESTALELGKKLLVLDTVTDSDAARLYTRLGWVRVGDIPDYALFPDGGYCATTYFYRRLGAS